MLFRSEHLLKIPSNIKMELTYYPSFNDEINETFLPKSTKTLKQTEFIQSKYRRIFVNRRESLCHNEIKNSTYRKEGLSEIQEEEITNEEEKSKNYSHWNNEINPQQSWGMGQNKQLDKYLQPGMSEEDQINLAIKMSLEQSNTENIDTISHIEPIASKS